MLLNRREMLGALGLFATTTLLDLPAYAHNSTSMEVQPCASSFWKPRNLDPANSAKIAYGGYWHANSGAAFGVFYGIVGQMGMKYGAPYNSFPFHMLAGYKSNIVDKGIICGELNGASSALSLFWNEKERLPIETELYEWYEQTELPIYHPEESKAKDINIIPSRANSILHHLSIGKWCHIADASPMSDLCNERCARVTADVAFKTTELINAKIDNS